MRLFIIIACLLIATVFVTAQQQTVQELTPLEILEVEVISERPHDTSAFTQGLLYHDGLLYESTGRRGFSTLRAVDPQTGEVLRRFDLPDEFFAEGLTLFDNYLYQITWQAQLAFIYDLEETTSTTGSFNQLGAFVYSGEGWGLCSDDSQLYMSNGSSTIVVRDPNTFEPQGFYPVTMHGVFVDEINELECVDEHIYANIWRSDTIIRFDKLTGIVDAVIDTSDLLSPEVRAGLGSDAVLNGIAYDADNDVFYITGKLWSQLFEVQFVPTS